MWEIADVLRIIDVISFHSRSNYFLLNKRWITTCMGNFHHAWLIVKRKKFRPQLPILSVVVLLLLSKLILVTLKMSKDSLSLSSLQACSKVLGKDQGTTVVKEGNGKQHWTWLEEDFASSASSHLPCFTADLSDPLSRNELFLVTRNIEQETR